MRVFRRRSRIAQDPHATGGSKESAQGLHRACGARSRRKGGNRAVLWGKATRVQPLLCDLMVPADHGRQSVRLLKGWVGKPETRCPTPAVGKHGCPISEGSDT
jgi:hypothetical protein